MRNRRVCRKYKMFVFNTSNTKPVFKNSVLNTTYYSICTIQKKHQEP